MKRVRINVTVGQDAQSAQHAYNKLIEALDTLGEFVSYETEWSQVDGGEVTVYQP